MSLFPKKAEPISDEHAFAETRDLHPTDILLRKHGFKIHSRPTNGVPVWSKGGFFLTQDEAVEVATSAEVLQKAKG